MYSISIIALNTKFDQIFLKNVNFFISAKSKQSQNFVKKNIGVKFGQDNVYQIIDIGYKAFKIAYKSTSTKYLCNSNTIAILFNSYVV